LLAFLCYTKSCTSLEYYAHRVHKFLQLLDEHQLYVNHSKCAFGVYEVEYLARIVFHEYIKVDPNKVKFIVECPIHQTLKNFRGFLGFTCIYYKLVMNHSLIATPLTPSLENDVFSWT